MNMKKYILGLLLTLSIPGFSQTLSLQQCQQMAHNHNIALRTARNNITMAEEQKKEAFTNYFPTISASGLAFAANKNQISYNLGDMQLDMIKNGTFASVDAVQPIFAGGQIMNNNKLAKVGLEIGKLQLQQSENEVVLTTQQYYWNIVTLKEKLNTISFVQTMLSQLDKDVTTFVKAGITTRNDLLQVQLRRNEVESQKTQIENALSICKLVLAQYIGVSSENFDVESHVNADEMPEFPLDLKQDYKQALSNIPEYRLLEKNVEAKNFDYKIEIGKNLPTLGVGASYGYNHILDKGGASGIVFVKLSVPISDWWGGSHAIKRKSIAEQNARDLLKDNSELLEIRMRKNWAEIDNAYKQLGLAKKSIDQSKENLKINTDMYQAGTTKMSDLMDAQSQYQQACDKYVDAYAMLETKILEYKQSVGIR
jgi:outer membrane protein TolC